MSDNKQLKGQQDSSKVNSHETYEVEDLQPERRGQNRNPLGKGFVRLSAAVFEKKNYHG